MANAAERQKKLRNRRRQNGEMRQFNIWLRSDVFELIQNQAKSLGLSQAELLEQTIVKVFGNDSTSLPVVNVAPSREELSLKKQNVVKAISKLKSEQKRISKKTIEPTETAADGSSQGGLF